MIPQTYEGFRGESWLEPVELDKLIDLAPPRGWMLEVGTASGVTAAQIAAARPEVRIVSVDRYDEHQERAIDWVANRRHNQDLWVGDLSTLTIFCREKFGLTFVDGDHFYRGCWSDLLHAATLTRPDGLIVAHDYGAPDWAQVRLAVDRFCAECGWEIAEVVHSLAIMRRKAQ